MALSLLIHKRYFDWLIALLICLSYLSLWEFLTYVEFGQALNPSSILLLIIILPTFAFLIPQNLLKQFNLKKLLIISIVCLVLTSAKTALTFKTNLPIWGNYIGINVGEPSENLDGNFVLYNDQKIIYRKNSNWKDDIADFKENDYAIKTKWFLFKQTGFSQGYQFKDEMENSQEQSSVINILINTFFVLLEHILKPVIKYLLVLFIILLGYEIFFEPNRTRNHPFFIKQ